MKLPSDMTEEDLVKVSAILLRTVYALEWAFEWTPAHMAIALCFVADEYLADAPERAWVGGVLSAESTLKGRLNEGG
jgi:hypothetical protein